MTAAFRDSFRPKLSFRVRVVAWAFLLITGGSEITTAATVKLSGEVRDAQTGEPLAARVYLQDSEGTWLFVEGANAVVYDKTARTNPESVEKHTSIAEDSFQTDLEPGRYSLLVERGKEYFPALREIDVDSEPVAIRVDLKRWIHMEERGWFSGDTHVHRAMDDLPTAMLAEDLNVAFPLSYWVTKAFTPPSSGSRNIGGEIPAGLTEVNPTHVYWRRNTEYEIGSVNDQRHTLGAFFVLGHESVFTQGVPPLRAVAEQARAEGALLELDKHSWPWSMALPALMGVDLYELANNHVWRTTFGITRWTPSAPPHLLPPCGGETGNEREWVHYTLGNYYTLLNAGFRMRPTAGTASGVHPVPIGFGRVYVHLPEGFSYEAWKQGLNAGRSFVTTGPMLFATVNGRDPGHTFSGASGDTFHVEATIITEQPLTFGELILNGVPVKTIRPQNQKTAEGAFETRFTDDLALEESGWLAVRCWEDRPGGRFRYAHTAPWHVEIAGKPQRARAEDRDHLVTRMRDELNRSRPVFPPEAVAEYEEALAAYERIEVRDDSDAVRANARPPKDDEALRSQLENMVWHHHFTPIEIRAATGLAIGDNQAALERFDISDATRPSFPVETIRIQPYPGGRHPRTGFLEGAVNPQRETKVSVFTPWDPVSYVVVDVPEAVWSNLGLTYLAHTHVPTLWTERQVELPEMEWTRHADGSLAFERKLPNGIAFGSKVTPHRDHVEFDLWLTNGTPETLTDLRVQNCVMLKAARGFSAQSNQNKRLETPFAMVRSEDGNRWIITAWEHCHRPWANPPVPCMHSDPKFPDCAPGETQRLRGWLWFHEGTDVESQLARLQKHMTAPR